MSTEEIDFTDAQMLRKVALERLHEKTLNGNTPPQEADVKKLLHELQVHQIELEMQNEELRKAYEAAETALKKYTMLYDLSPIGYFTLDTDCTICDLNFAGSDMLGERRFSLIDSNFKLFVSEHSLPVFNIFIKNIFSGNAKEICKLMLGYDNKPLCTVYMEGVVTDDNRQCLLSLIDISGFEKPGNP